MNGGVVGVVLAGGESRRLGHDKALLRLADGITLLERTLAVLRAAGVDRVALSVSTGERGHALQDAVPAARDLPLVVDTVPGCGPLGGLHAALGAFPGRRVLLVACDLPRLSPVALRALLDEPSGVDVLLPRAAGRLQTLHALYGPACLPITERLIAQERLAMRALLAAPGLRVRVLDEDWWRRRGIAVSAFDNLNTPADLADLAALGDGAAPVPADG